MKNAAKLTQHEPVRESGDEPYRLSPLLFPEMLGDRRREILLAAANLFAQKGYKGTSIRDIADSLGLLAGSLYHHFRSKEALFLEIHGEALRVAGECIDAAVEGVDDPWERLYEACRTHLEIQLHPESLTLPLMDDLMTVSEQLRAGLIVQRDAFERRFRAYVDAVPLPSRIDRSVYRLTLLTLLNNAVRWYKPGRLKPTDIARQIFEIYRHDEPSERPKHP